MLKCMQLTSEQEKIIEYTKAGLSFKVLAYAGSGKTSTMIYVCKEATLRKSQFNRYSKGLFLAFNSAIAKDASEKLKTHNINTQAKTWHALALNKIKKDYEKKLYALRKADLLLRQYLKFNFYLNDQRLAVKKDLLPSTENKSPTTQMIFRDVSKNTCKGYMIKAINNYFSSTDEEFSLKHFKTVCPKWADEEFFLNQFVSNTILIETKKLVENIFNTEELGYPLSFSAALKIYQLTKPKLHLEFDFLIVDEAQDTDLVALDIINNQDLNKIQIMVVGDSYQQIYGWRGALDALDKVQIDEILYLSKSFRFGQNLANFASGILLNNFNNFKKNIIGNEKKETKVLEERSCKYFNYNAIITRTNAGAFDAFIKAIEQKPDLLIAVDLDIKKLDKYLTDYAKLQKNQKLDSDSDLILFENIEQLEEYVDENPTDSDVSAPYRLIIKVGLAGLQQKIIEVKKAQKKENDNQKYDLIISTAHKSKGLQFDHVVIFEDFNPFLFQELNTNEGKFYEYMPVTDEEARLFYVAVTRSILSVTLENFTLLFVEEISKLGSQKIGFPNNDHLAQNLIHQDMVLCHKILIKNQDSFLKNCDLNTILSKHNIYEIIQYFLNNR